MVTKSSYFHLVIEKNDTLNNKVITELELNNYLKDNESIVFYAFVLHNKDVKESGEIEREHYHVVIVLKCPYSKTTIINDIAKCLLINKSCIGSRKIRDFVLMVQYLIHKNDKEKYQYDLLDIWTSDVNEVIGIMNEGISQFDLDINYLIELVNSCDSITSVYKELGLKKSRTYRSILIDLWKDRRNEV